VARVDHGVELGAGHQRPDDGLVDLVVQDGALLERVHRADGLVVPVLLVAVRVGDLRAQPREVEHQGVAAAAPLHQPLHRHPDVVLGGHPERVLLVVCVHRSGPFSSLRQTEMRTWTVPLHTSEHDDAVAGEGEALAEELPHALDVVDGAPQLAAAPARAAVRDADQDGALLAAAAARREARDGSRPRQRRQREPRGQRPPDASHAAALRALDGALAGAHGQARAAVLAPDRRRRRGPSTHVHGEASRPGARSFACAACYALLAS
jgi:hypothetical protein